MSYRINETFFSLQGEGARAGSVNVFVRFAGCNLQCTKDGPEGFDCDTEFTSGVDYEGDVLVEHCAELVPAGQALHDVGVIFTGGEPLLQLDEILLAGFKAFGFGELCVETNGTREIPPGIDWISCSPKTAEHTLKLKDADELRYVRRAGMGIPRPSVSADYYYISPAFQADGHVLREDLDYCVKLVQHNPRWRLSVQQHKLWGVR